MKPALDDTEQLGMLIGETARLWRGRLDQRLQPLGLSQARWLVLIHLWRGGDGIIQRELARRLGIEGPSLVGLLDRMAEDGWIERRESSEDRRSKTVHLTDKALEGVRQIRTAAAQLRKELLRDIGPADVRTCLQVLRQIKNHAEESGT